jgi:uncharacterized protein YigA (DUF484 family)
MRVRWVCVAAALAGEVFLPVFCGLPHGRAEQCGHNAPRRAYMCVAEAQHRAGSVEKVRQPEQEGQDGR